MAARESGNSNSENARTTVQRARAKPSARQVEPIRAFPPSGKSIHRPTLESRVAQPPLSAEPPQGSQSAPTTVCDESRAPSAATFRFAGPPSAPATPTAETSMTIRQPQRRPLAFPLVTADLQKSIAPENADRFGIELRVAREQRPVLRRASLAVLARMAAPCFPATEAPGPQCTRWPQKSIESSNRAGRGVLPPAESRLRTPRN